MAYGNSVKKYENMSDDDLKTQTKIEKFLHAASLDLFKIVEIAGDASSRRYFRVFHKDGTYIVMDASSEADTVRPFIRVGDFLNTNGIKAPIIYHQDLENNMLLVEDFGDGVYTQLLAQKPELEMQLYQGAIDVLIRIQNSTTEIDLPKESSELLKSKLDAFMQWFVEDKIEGRYITSAKKDLYNVLDELLEFNYSIKPSVSLRDYHSPNLIYLAENTGIEKVGVVDFQDAMLGSRAYDVVSLLKDARRDVKPETVEACLEHYLNNVSVNKDDFKTSYEILGIQRNLRIVGYFHRLKLLRNKGQYIQHLPRISSYIREALELPVLEGIKKWFQRYEITI